MIGIMLLGAWFLVHQHCCVADIRSSSRNNLVDHLMRRSPLEKNFMRYGRSWPPPSFIPNSMWQLDEKLNKPEKKGKTGRDIMRFGRSNLAPLEGSKGNEGYKYLYPLVPGNPFRMDNLRSAGTRLENNGDAFRVGVNGDYFEPLVPKVVRNKKNFIRFGRNSKQTSPEVDAKPFNGKKDGAIEEESDSTHTGYGTDEDPNDKRSSTYGHLSPSSAKKQDPAFNEEEDHSAHNILSSGYQTEHGNTLNGEAVRVRGLVNPLTLDATSFIAPEFVLLPNIPPQQNAHKRANNFIRLG
uniref:UvrABC system protein B n=1 Tax=Lygus hesperus TaxID=30085 RepID=A0A0A9YQC2_LYGHE